MFCAHIRFDCLPQIGFAHHFYAENYSQTYGKPHHKHFELVYIKSGGINVSLYGEQFTVEPGSVFVLFRHLPMRLTSIDSSAQAHCSVQISMPYHFSLVEEGEAHPEEASGIFLPFVIPPGAEAEAIKKELYSIAAQISISRESNQLSASLAASGVLEKINRIYRTRFAKSKTGSYYLSYKIKQYIAWNRDKNLTIGEIAKALDKTPNYINSVFKEETGITIRQYLNRERARTIAELMEIKGLSFKEACENALVEDATYGYRLFKKHMGVTPREYLAAGRKSESKR